MKSLKLIRLMCIAVFLMSTAQLMAQNGDKTLSPYFKIISENGSKQLPLKSTSAKVNIVGAIADVTIYQEYHNIGSSPIEAQYVFPTSTQAAIYDMEMKIGNKTIKAIIQEKNKARNNYEQAKTEGMRASLLEQNRPNIFTIHVANILPNDLITISLKYTETLIPEEGKYSFVYPTVVGPRYTGEEVANQGHLGNRVEGVPYTKEGILPSYDFDISTSLSAGMPIQDLSCGTHKMSIKYDGLDKALMTLDASEIRGGNRDVVIEYQLSGKEIDSGLLLYEGEEENHFMLTVQPPKVVRDRNIPQREYIFVVDVSGSMRGFPLSVSKKLMRNLLSNLRYNDMFNVVLFASGSRIYSKESVYATQENIGEAMAMIGGSSGGGGTNLMAALTTSINIPKCENGLSRSVIMITDGYISVEKSVFDLIRDNNNEFNFYSFGIGSSVNRFLIEGIAHVGNGEAIIIKNKTEAMEKAEKFRLYISAPILTNVKIDWDGFDVYDLEPSNFSDVLAQRPIVILGKYRGSPKGKIQLSGITGDGPYSNLINAENSSPHKRHAALSILWARKRIQILDDYIDITGNSKSIAEVVRLGLKYNLITAFTSFIAIDNEVALDKNEVASKVNQPLPLPEGVSNHAISSYTAQAHGLGADLSIRNNQASKRVKQIEVVKSNISGVHLKLISLQLADHFKDFKKQFSNTTFKDIEVIIQIDSKGKVVLVSLVGIDENSMKTSRLLKAIKSWQIKNLNQQFIDLRIKLV